ncbi:very short patch repair endonuclease [Bacteroides caecigallinarum]|uniref:very short patch repair endonuclease n=1 Tax=Bacteroides caecigallinarum TaxID=1411144 RepID=UPI0021D46D16|nr:very short patch repair endonuclease [Bacteroides caecigallinarum]MCF2582140.1 DNA mismatch endonuclease Vsr [Bacteroides caecigallinarum]
MDKLTPEQRHRNMQNVHSKGTKIEIIFAKLLHEAGVKYIKNDCKVFGCPDFVFRQRKVAVFLDGDFWHGKNWDIHRNDHKTNQKFWHNKIERNIKRDKEVNAALIDAGWTVLRFWETEINKTPDVCLNKVLRILQNKNNRAMGNLSIIENIKGTKVKMQYYGPHCFDAEGNVMSFGSQMAVVSHYLHNKGYASDKTYKEKALGLMEDMYLGMEEKREKKMW